MNDDHSHRELLLKRALCGGLILVGFLSGGTLPTLCSWLEYFSYHGETIERLGCPKSARCSCQARRLQRKRPNGRGSGDRGLVRFAPVKTAVKCSMSLAVISPHGTSRAS